MEAVRAVLIVEVAAHTVAVAARIAHIAVVEVHTVAVVEAHVAHTVEVAPRVVRVDADKEWYVEL